MDTSVPDFWTCQQICLYKCPHLHVGSCLRNIDPLANTPAINKCSDETGPTDMKAFRLDFFFFFLESVSRDEREAEWKTGIKPSHGAEVFTDRCESRQGGTRFLWSGSSQSSAPPRRTQTCVRALAGRGGVRGPACVLTSAPRHALVCENL